MKRVAKCHCGHFSVTTTGNPEQVVMCHCEECQRRTGSSYSLGAIFERPNVDSCGEYKTYQRVGDLGFRFTFHFCPECGSNVYWIFSSPDRELYIVAVGCYADPSFPGPVVSLYGKRRHHWLPGLEDVPRFIGGRGSEPE